LPMFHVVTKSLSGSGGAFGVMSSSAPGAKLCQAVPSGMESWQAVRSCVTLRQVAARVCAAAGALPCTGASGDGNGTAGTLGWRKPMVLRAKVAEQTLVAISTPCGGARRGGGGASGCRTGHVCRGRSDNGARPRRDRGGTARGQRRKETEKAKQRRCLWREARASLAKAEETSAQSLPCFRRREGEGEREAHRTWPAAPP
jgi:hypothetical protein